jgi:hypothetical protein
MSDAALRAWEFASYIVTVLGLPLALFAIWREMRAERKNELKEIEQREDELYVELSQQYTAFLESVLGNPDLDLLSEAQNPLPLSPAQQQKRRIYYEMLIALFERAFILLYEPGASGDAARRWQSWADYIAWWLAKPDFRAYALENLDGEDAAFAAFLRTSVGK